MAIRRSNIPTTVGLLLLLAIPCFSRGGGGAGGFDMRNMDSEVYQIDYRGPETHSYIPPPDRAHRQRGMPRRRSKAHTAGNARANVNKIHG